MCHAIKKRDGFWRTFLSFCKQTMRISLLFKAFGLAFLLACSSVWAAVPLPVVASFSILADVAQHLGGERIQVQPLVADTAT